MHLTNQVREFMKAQYLQNESRDKIQRSSHLIETYILGLLRHARILSKVRKRYFENVEFALY